jgi:hypothetical protein
MISDNIVGADYTAIFTSSSGPGMAHVVSHPDYRLAWSIVNKTYAKRGCLIALVPGRHKTIMKGQMIDIRDTFIIDQKIRRSGA